MTKINNFVDMKYLITFLVLFLLIFSSCETEFEVNANWEEVMVVYGLLDQSRPQQYIKINKAYLSDGDALEMASFSNSVNYNPDSLEVKIFKVKDGPFGIIDTLDFRLLNDTILEKDDGLFATDENIIYTTSSDFFLTNNANEKDYILSILNTRSGKKVSAKTNLIYELKLDIPAAKPMGLYGTVPDPIVLPLEKSQTTVNWDHSQNGRR